jgi:hypothetical protein
MFLVAELKPIFTTGFLGMYVLNLRTKFHKCNTDGSAVTSMKPKARYRFHTAAILQSLIKKHNSPKVRSQDGRVVAQAVSRWLPTVAARVSVRASMWSLWWTKRHWGRFSPSTSVSPANHSTNFSIIIITRVWHNRSISGRSAEWTQLDSTPNYINYSKTCLKRNFVLNGNIFRSRDWIQGENILDP